MVYIGVVGIWAQGCQQRGHAVQEQHIVASILQKIPDCRSSSEQLAADLPFVPELLESSIGIAGMDYLQIAAVKGRTHKVCVCVLH